MLTEFKTRLSLGQEEFEGAKWKYDHFHLKTSNSNQFLHFYCILLTDGYR